jgi:hypothetical protein
VGHRTLNNVREKGTGKLNTSVGVREVEADSLYQYYVYGITVRSEIPLALPRQGDGGLARVELRLASASYFAERIRGVNFQTDAGDWYQYASLPNGSSYVRWSDVGEFLVSANGLCIACRRAEKASLESFQVYMLGQALSFALVKRGFEPLHATVVVVNGKAVAFLGDSGFGKSSLAACFLERGHRVLTDDLLIVQESGSCVLAYPGPPRIKLFPNMASRFLGKSAIGVPMNLEAKKLIVSMDAQRSCGVPVPLGAVYSVADPREVLRNQHVSIEPLTPREGFLALVKNSFNRRLVNPERLERQFTTTARLVDRIAVKKLSYPRVLGRLPEVREAVLSNLSCVEPEVCACSC